MMLAEANSTYHHRTGFDATFAWNWHGFGGGNMPDLYQGKIDLPTFAGRIGTEISAYGDGKTRLYFTSNHDENSWENSAVDFYGDAAKAFSVFTFTFHGMPLLYNGQEIGNTDELQFFEKDPIKWVDAPEWENFYQALIEVRQSNSALWLYPDGGEYQALENTNEEQILSFGRSNDNNNLIVAINFSDSEATATITNSLPQGNYTEVFSDQSASLGSEISLTLPAWGYTIYQN